MAGSSVYASTREVPRLTGVLRSLYSHDDEVRTGPALAPRRAVPPNGHPPLAARLPPHQPLPRARSRPLPARCPPAGERPRRRARRSRPARPAGAQAPRRPARRHRVRPRLLPGRRHLLRVLRAWRRPLPRAQGGEGGVPALRHGRRGGEPTPPTHTRARARATAAPRNPTGPQPPNPHTPHPTPHTPHARLGRGRQRSAGATGSDDLWCLSALLTTMRITSSLVDFFRALARRAPPPPAGPAPAPHPRPQNTRAVSGTG